MNDLASATSVVPHLRAPTAVPRLRIAVVLGTRPELLKLVPVIAELERQPQVQVQVILTGQHRELLHGLPELFGLRSYRQLAVRNDSPNLPALTSLLLQELDAVFASEPCDAVVVQGDTTTAFCAALAAFYRRIPVAHVEAGLRTLNPSEPFPEEINRQLVGRLARWHFAPTAAAAANLAAENLGPEGIEVTGNTIIDTLAMVRSQHLHADYPETMLHLEAPQLAAALAAIRAKGGKTLALLTLHRRENQGNKLTAFLSMLREMAGRYPDYHLIYPYHLNPQVRLPAQALLGNLANVHLVAPLSYRPMLYLMGLVDFALSDSGGLQEEFPSFGKPLLVLRDATERPELLTAKMGRLVGLDPALVAAAVDDLIACTRRGATPAWYQAGGNPFGDGRAAQRIVGRLLRDLAGTAVAHAPAA